MTMLALLLMASTTTVPAALDTAARPISLAEATTLAERNAPAVIQAQGSVSTAEASVRSAYAQFLPSLSLSTGFVRQVPAQSGTRVENGQVVTVASQPWSLNAGFAANIDLFTGGSHFFEVNRARAEAVGARAALVGQRYAAVLAAKQQFFAVLAARESEEAARATLQQAEQQLQVSILRLRQRVVTRSDSLRSQIAVQNARLAVATAENTLATSNAGLTRATGSPKLVTAVGDDSLDRPTLALNEIELRELALQGPATQQARASREAASASLRGAWGSFLPTVSASYSRNGFGTADQFGFDPTTLDYSGAVRLSVSVPLFDQYQRAQSLTVAHVQRDNAEASLKDAQLQALEGLVQSLGAFRLAAERVSTQRVTVEAATEDLREQQEKYQIGASTLLDVLASQATLDQARQDLVQARYDQRVAKAQLEALVGRSL
jgi:outer membrane protein